MNKRDRAVEEMKAHADRATDEAARWAAEVAASTLRTPTQEERSAYAFGWLMGRQQIIEAMKRADKRRNY